jgi:hypothetical protein
VGLLIEAAGGNVLRLARPVWAQSAKSVSDGVYTSEQANRGQGSYQMACSSCHGPTLGGDAFAPPLVGAPFTERWQEGSVGDLLLLIKTTMPQDRPGALGADMYADIVSFLLKMNNYPAGQSELDLDPDKSKSIRFSK